MICYKDKTFCGNKKHSKNCTHQITQEELEHAQEIGLPIAYGDMCEQVDFTN